MLFRSNDTATTEIYTRPNTLSLHDALPIARFSIGANVVGTTSSYAQDVGDLRLPGFTQVNGFAQWRWTDRLLLSLNANNLFDVRGFTESEDGAIPANGIVRARSINGRTTSLTLRVGL